MATIWWHDVHRWQVSKWHERVKWWIEHCDKCERQNGEHIRNLSRIAEGAIATNEAYREFLRDKIIIDLSATKRREPPQA
jgi:hypothetical protein